MSISKPASEYENSLISNGKNFNDNFYDEFYSKLKKANEKSAKYVKSPKTLKNKKDQNTHTSTNKNVFSPHAMSDYLNKNKKKNSDGFPYLKKINKSAMEDEERILILNEAKINSIVDKNFAKIVPHTKKSHTMYKGISNKLLPLKSKNNDTPEEKENNEQCIIMKKREIKNSTILDKKVSIGNDGLKKRNKSCFANIFKCFG